MFNVGELIIYSAHGICHIDGICEKKIDGEKREYYTLHPIDNEALSISIPVESDKVTMLPLIDEEEAKEILESFKEPGISWIEPKSKRNKEYSNLVKSGDRKEISKLVSTLMRKKRKIEKEGRKFYEQDNKLLNHIQEVLFKELSLQLDTTFEAISRKVNRLVNESLS